MKAEILSVGTELLLGQIVDTNANYLAQQLCLLGIDLYFVSQVGDNQSRLVDTLRRACQRSNLVIVTGGLGPTEDDLTREAIAELRGETMEVQPELESHLRALFTGRGRSMPERNVKQATTIASASVLSNPIGTAPGWWVEGDGCVIAAMPGVPHEMRRMWEVEVAPRLAERVGAGTIVSRTLKLVGLGESNVEESLGSLTRSTNPTLATYAKPDGIHLRLTAKAPTREEAEQLVAELEPLVRARVGDLVYGIDEETLPEAIGRLLKGQGLTLTTAESATGGDVASALTETAGASDYYRGGFIVYSREAKEALGVPRGLLDVHGTIAEETSRALARAARERLGVAVGVATTGVAGPGPSEGKPAGTLHVAVDVLGDVRTSSSSYATTRAAFKKRGALEALHLLWRTLREREP